MFGRQSVWCLGAHCWIGSTCRIVDTQSNGVPSVGEALRVSVRDSVVVLDFSEFSVDHDVLFERVSEIAPVIEHVVRADVARLGMDDEEHARLLPLVLAGDLTYQAHLHAAKIAANRIIDILAGRLTGAQMGYPEFESPHDLDD
jgi:hypothetical protein